MPLLRLFVIVLYPLCVFAVILRRPRQAAMAAGAAGATVERSVWAQSPRRLRILVLIAIALLLTCFGKVGGPLGLVFALITAPIAAAGAMRLVTVTSTGLLVDSEYASWTELAGWTLDGSGRLVVLRRDPSRPAIALQIAGPGLSAATSALANHLPEIRAP